jgi:UDP-arabinose 4-epimerase
MTVSVLVTGGAGYIGSHACKALAAAGYLPVAYDSLERGHAWAAKWGPLEVGNILDKGRLSAVLANYSPRAVLHFAAYTYVGESVEQPQKYHRNNVIGTLTLLEAMREQGINQIVFSSSCAVYGTPQAVPLVESHPQRPISPYGENKRDVENLLREHARLRGLHYVSLRYFNAAGADPDGEIGEVHEPETHLIPLILEAAYGSRRSIAVYGNDYPTRDGTCIRDYVHVSDLADAHVLALGYLERGGESCGINLGNGTGSSVLEIVAAARRVTGKRIPVTIAARRPGDPAELLADAALAARALGWKPRFPDIDVQVAHAWKWLLASRPKARRASA